MLVREEGLVMPYHLSGIQVILSPSQHVSAAGQTLRDIQRSYRIITAQHSLGHSCK